jgi:DNA-binding MarR family transcriptional regulator
MVRSRTEEGKSRTGPIFESKFRTADSSPGFLLWKAANLHQRLQRRKLAQFGLTPTQFSVLACYGSLTSPESLITQADVCQYAALDKMIVSDATRALVDKGLLDRVPSETDRRAATITVTQRGRKICNDAIRIVEELDTEFFGQAGNVNSLVQQLQDLTR